MRIVDSRLSVAFNHGAVAVLGLPRRGASAGRPVLTVERLELTGARVAVTAPSGKATASVEATMTQGKNGPMTGQATVDTVMIPVNGKPIRITADGTRVVVWSMTASHCNSLSPMPCWRFPSTAPCCRATGWRTSPTKQDH